MGTRSRRKEGLKLHTFSNSFIKKNCSKPIQNVILGKHAKTNEKETSKVIFRLSFVPLIQIQSFKAAVSNFVWAYPGGYVKNLAKYSIH